MNLQKILTTDNVRLGLPGSTKNEIIENLVDLIVDNGGLGSVRGDVLQAVLDREAQMSTGMKNSIAIPHGKTDSVKDLHACIALSAEPVDFSSMDGEPSRIFVMTVSPKSRSGPHLQFLAEVSRLLTRNDLRDRILAAEDPETLLRLFLEE